MQRTSKQNGIKSDKRNGWKIILGSAIFMLLLIPISASAAAERYVLKFNDLQLQGYRGEPAEIFLKMALRQQYPSVNPANLRLQRVVLVGKTQHGIGRARLQVGSSRSEPYRVNGLPQLFWNNQRWSFDRVVIKNPDRKSRGPWKMKLQGNFVVRKVVLEVQEKHRHHKWYGSYRFDRRFR